MKKTIILSSLLLASSIFADGISFSDIQKVKSSDSLNIRAKADYKSKKISSIPANQTCIKNYGCGKDIAFEAILQMQEAEAEVFYTQAKKGWCYVEYKGVSGWVNKVYLQESKTQCK